MSPRNTAKKRREVWIDEESIKVLQKAADKDGRSLKSLLEKIINDFATHLKTAQKKK